MPDCPHCAHAIPAGAPACPHCGKVVTTGQQFSGDLGGLFGCLSSVVLLYLWFVAGVSIAGTFSGCHGSRLYDLGTIVVCLAALWSGIRASRRGKPGISLLLVIPTIVVLLPATACAVTVLSTCR